ncbi:oxidoreductase, short chain dehydrogenase/reductase family protein, partial [[Clostridium] asparagiforme DSM 15981]
MQLQIIIAQGFHLLYPIFLQFIIRKVHFIRQSLEIGPTNVYNSCKGYNIWKNTTERRQYMPRKTVLVTGASRGIGKAVAIKFAKKGYNVVISCVHRAEQLEQTRREIESFQAPCLAYLGDMGDLKSCETLFSQIRSRFGGVDVLVNNAGISYIGLLQDMSSEDWERMLHVNLTSVFNCCKLAIPYMVRQKQGKIVNVSSVWGVVGASCETAYSATKGGINALTKALAKELAPSNIQVNAVACGAIDTEMNQWMEEDELIALVEDIPAGRLGSAEEVADLVYHLGYKNAYLTGQVIGLDGGWI